MSPVNLKDWMEEVVKYTLESHINETLEFDLGLSKSFCSNLLKLDPDDPNTSTATESFEGVPPYPLYKRLASALLESINSKAFCRKYSDLNFIPEGSSSKQEENEWKKLVLDKGSEIVNILKSVVHELHVQEPFFSQLKDGKKTIEGRCAIGDYNRIGSGTLICFNKCVVFEVQDAHWYASFSEMLGAESLAKVLPGVETIEEGIQIYRNFYTEEKEKTNGVLAIHVLKVDVQPYACLATLLSVLSYGGVQGLLGLTHTTGTIPNALPPPRSTLLSSFTLPYKPNHLTLENLMASKGSSGSTKLETAYLIAESVDNFLIVVFLAHLYSERLDRLVYENYIWLNCKFSHWLEVEGCTLTHGARALAKHANRSTSKYWGTLEGSDAIENVSFSPLKNGVEFEVVGSRSIGCMCNLKGKTYLFAACAYQMSIHILDYDKNGLAMDVVCHVIEHCGWLNVHIVPPHGAVFEIRVADGYGARWSKDGCKFPGLSSFLIRWRRYGFEPACQPINSSELAELGNLRAVEYKANSALSALSASHHTPPRIYPGAIWRKGAKTNFSRFSKIFFI
uniref:ASCH domain-containing protein n=1 Tax=Quercus lobata TaxID=97700 RepID=A0A7N2MSZ8_QUELO